MLEVLSKGLIKRSSGFAFYSEFPIAVMVEPEPAVEGYDSNFFLGVSKTLSGRF